MPIVLLVVCNSGWKGNKTKPFFRQVSRQKLILSPCTTNVKKSRRREKDNLPIRLR